MSYELACKYLRETNDAVLIDDGENEPVWFPLSQVERMSFDRNGNGMIKVTDWIAQKKGYL